MRECYQKKQITLIYEESKLNHSDILTKHVPEGTHLEHSRKICEGLMRVWTDYEKFRAVAEVMMTLLAQHKEGGCCGAVLPLGLCAVPINRTDEGNDERPQEVRAEPRLDP